MQDSAFMKKTSLLAIVLSVACSSSKPASPPPAAPSQFKNVQVLDRTASREELIKVMRGFTRGLGVRCDYCHVQTATEPKPEFDFASDAKQEKLIARKMIQMTAQINGSWLPQVAEGGETPRISCWTCHRGKTEPELTAPQQQEGPH
jgi:hypothetical protein